MTINWRNIFKFWVLLISGVLVVTRLNSAIGFKPDATVTQIAYIAHVVSWMAWGALFAAGIARLPFTKSNQTT